MIRSKGVKYFKKILCCFHGVKREKENVCCASYDYVQKGLQFNHFKPTKPKADSYFLLTWNKNSINIASSFKRAIEDFALGFTRCCFERTKIQQFHAISNPLNIKRIHIFSPPGIKIPLISLPRFNISSCQMPHLILVQIGVSLIIETN